MRSRETDISHVQLLLEAVDAPQRDALQKHLEWLARNDKWYGIDFEFLGFMEDYQTLAALVRRHTIKGAPPMIQGHSYTVIDVGCATALQHVFFKTADRYIGIDQSAEGCPDPEFFRPNCSFLRGRFLDVVDSGQIEEYRQADGVIGIAHMSLLYGGGEKDVETFNSFFKRKWLF